MDAGGKLQWARILGRLFCHLEKSRQGLVLQPAFQLHNTQVHERVYIRGVVPQCLGEELLGLLKMALLDGCNGC
jgi:hypothetical protein